MDRKLALVATVLCLSVASGCKRGEQRRGNASDSSSTEAVNADIDRVPEQEPSVPEPEVVVGEQPRAIPPVRWMSPERWLALQSAAAWSGKRDKPRPVVALPSPSVQPPEGVVSDEAEVPTETTEAPSATTSPSSDEVAAAESESVAKEDEDTSESTSSSNADEEAEKALRLYEAAMVGAGPGYTGMGAGDAGYTGIGAGAGFTGFGAGNGFTGMGAGPGFTGMFASVPSEATASTRSMQVSFGGAESAQGATTKATAPMPIVVVWPVFIDPW